MSYDKTVMNVSSSRHSVVPFMIRTLPWFAYLLTALTLSCPAGVVKPLLFSSGTIFGNLPFISEGTGKEDIQTVLVNLFNFENLYLSVGLDENLFVHVPVAKYNALTSLFSHIWGQVFQHLLSYILLWSINCLSRPTFGTTEKKTATLKARSTTCISNTAS